MPYVVTTLAGRSCGGRAPPSTTVRNAGGVDAGQRRRHQRHQVRTVVGGHRHRVGGSKRVLHRQPAAACNARVTTDSPPTWASGRQAIQWSSPAQPRRAVVAAAEARRRRGSARRPSPAPVDPLVTTTKASPGSIDWPPSSVTSPDASITQPAPSTAAPPRGPPAEGAVDGEGGVAPVPHAAQRVDEGGPGQIDRDERGASSRLHRAAADGGATVDDERLAGDPRRLVADEERRQVGDVVGLAEAPVGMELASRSPKLSTSTAAKSVSTRPGAMPTTRVGPISPASTRVEVDRSRPWSGCRHRGRSSDRRPADRRDVDDHARLGGEGVALRGLAPEQRAAEVDLERLVVGRAARRRGSRRSTGWSPRC